MTMNSAERTEKPDTRYDVQTIPPVRLPLDMGSLVEAFKHILDRVYSGIFSVTRIPEFCL